MSRDRESFLASLRVDSDTIAKTNEVGKSYAAKANSSKANGTSRSDGGRERGDTGPGALGRESGYKTGLSDRAQAVKSNSNTSQTANNGSRSTTVNANGVSGSRSASVRGAVSGQGTGQGAKGATASGGQSGGQGGGQSGGQGGGQGGGQSGGQGR